MTQDVSAVAFGSIVSGGLLQHATQAYRVTFASSSDTSIISWVENVFPQSEHVGGSRRSTRSNRRLNIGLTSLAREAA